MTPIPCPRCGYHAPEEPCPHCGGRATIASLERPPSGPVRGALDGLVAVPMGLLLLARSRGTKRWLVPPLLVTSAVLVALLWFAFAWASGVISGALPDRVDLTDQGWARGDWLEGSWAWVQATWGGIVIGLQWVVDLLYGMVSWRPLSWLVYLLVGSLIAWYAFSILYEALAGPFLDEVHARLEKRWFGADPRSALERPNAIPEDRCWKRSMQAAGGAAVILIASLFVPGWPLWIALVAMPIPLLVTAIADRDYGEWLGWMARVEGRATWVSLQAAAITGLILVFALPIYFIPFGVGYVLFAAVTGFATAIGLLDIAFERRGIRLRQRLSFLARYWLAMVSFGAVAGLLLAIPILGPVLMVPGASVGGLWLLCRLDKSPLRSGRQGR